MSDRKEFQPARSAPRPESVTYRSTLYPRHSIMSNVCAAQNAPDQYLISIGRE